MGKRYTAIDVANELALIEGLENINLIDVLELDGQGKTDALDIVSRSRVIENLKLLDAWLGVLRDETELIDAERVVGFFDDESNYTYPDEVLDESDDLEIFSSDADDEAHEVTTADILESFMTYDFEVFVFVVADMDDDMALQMAEELAHMQVDLEIQVHPVVKELLRHHPEYMAALEKIDGNEELERKLEYSLGGAAGALLHGKTVSDLYFKVPSTQSSTEDPEEILVVDFPEEDDNQLPLQPEVSVFPTETPPLVVHLPPNEPPDTAPPVEPVEDSPQANEDDPVNPKDEPIVTSLPPVASDSYLPTQEESAAEAVMMGIIESSSSVLDYHELFSSFFFETKRSAWSEEFLDYLEQKYAASYV